MKLAEIDEAMLEGLDSAYDGVFSLLRMYCLTDGYEVHLTVQTHLEGLDEGQMMLYIQLLRGGDTIDYTAVSMEGVVQEIGWNLYFRDSLSSVRTSLAGLLARIAAAEVE